MTDNEIREILINLTKEIRVKGQRIFFMYDANDGSDDILCGVNGKISVEEIIATATDTLSRTVIK